MCLTLNTLLRNKWNSYRYANFLAKVVIRECKQSWVESRRSMKQHNQEFADCAYLCKFIKVKESRGLVRMNTFIQFQKQESSLSRDSRRHISQKGHSPKSQISNNFKAGEGTRKKIRGNSIANIEMTPGLKQLIDNINQNQNYSFCSEKPALTWKSKRNTI